MSSQLSIFSKMSALAREYEAINLGQGFPDYACDPKLLSSVTTALNSNHNQYAPMMGVEKLRTAIANKLNSSYGCQIDATNVCMTAGATQGIFTAILSNLTSDDEVIIFEPAYDSYRPTLEQIGATVVPIEIDPPYNRLPWNRVGQAITEKTKMIIINSPHNPTGQVLEQADLAALEELIRNKDIIVLSDEVYEHLIYDGKAHESLLKYPSLRKQGIAVYSFGKSLHATGWKLGYVVTTDQLMKKFTAVHQWNVFCVNSFVQHGIADYMNDSTVFDNIAPFLQTKRDFLISGMESLGLKLLPCQGTYFALWDYSELSEQPDIAFAEYLVKEIGLATIPISPFISGEGSSQVLRLCFAKELSTLEQALDRLKKLSS